MPNQNASDLDKTLNYAAENGAEVVDIVGVEGGEIDHQLGVFAALIEASPELEICMHMTEHVVMRCLDELELVLDEGTQLSLFAFTPCANVSISGVEFPLEDEPLASQHAASTMWHSGVQFKSKAMEPSWSSFPHID
ncbi:MAG: hypothetical protein Ct9H90mP16_07680 [Candidatus Poseidoniales archaeon]|nr:MAG: hypothetical protein Ct9H90mP16_07680 [Candidatus Poseidoniales archaeon]